MQPLSMLQLQMAAVNGVLKVHTECISPSSSHARSRSIACETETLLKSSRSGPSA